MPQQVCYMFGLLNHSVNRNEVIIKSANFGCQVILNSFCALDTFFLIGYAQFTCILYIILLFFITYILEHKETIKS